MTTRLRRSTLSALGVLALSTELDSTAQSSATAPPPPTIEVDRSTLVIDVATERRALDASIRRELARGLAAERAPKVTVSDTRPRG